MFTRCNKCNNDKLEVIEKVKAVELLGWTEIDPERENCIFYSCPQCTQIYWEGGMFDRAMKEYEEFLPKENPDPAI